MTTEYPLMLIGSELAQLAALKSEALRELDSAIAIYYERNKTTALSYFGLHTAEVLLLSPRRIGYSLYWHERMPLQDPRQGLIISVSREGEFLEVVNAVLAKMRWIRGRQKSFKFAAPLERSA